MVQNRIGSRPARSIVAVIAMFALSALQIACSHQAKDVEVPKAAVAKAPPQAAETTLKPAPKSKVSGTVQLIPEANSTRVIAKISGLKPKSEHGFHIHEVGDCSDPEFKAAGGHFNPTHKEHGAHDAMDSHAGDLGNLKADKKGIANYDVVIPHLNLSETPVVGRAVIVHEKTDDLKTQPTGNSGSRIACGVLEPQGAQAQ